MSIYLGNTKATGAATSKGTEVLVHPIYTFDLRIGTIVDSIGVPYGVWSPVALVDTNSYGQKVATVTTDKERNICTQTPYYCFGVENSRYDITEQIKQYPVTPDSACYVVFEDRYDAALSAQSETYEISGTIDGKLVYNTQHNTKKILGSKIPDGSQTQVMIPVAKWSQISVGGWGFTGAPNFKVWLVNLNRLHFI